MKQEPTPEVPQFLHRVANPSREDMAEFERIYLRPAMEKLAADIEASQPAGWLP